jgi:hypothetical protein
MRSIPIFLIVSSAILLAACGGNPPVNTVSKAELSCANAKQRLSQLVPAVNKAERTDDVQLMKTTLISAAVIVQDAQQEITALSNPPQAYLAKLGILAAAYQQAAKAAGNKDKAALSRSLRKAQAAQLQAAQQARLAGLKVCGKPINGHISHS